MKMSPSEETQSKELNGVKPTFTSRCQDPSLTLDERLKLLYPMVNEEETPLPRSWSPKDKFNFIGLSLNNLRVQYKGHGRTHKDASSVRATHPIPVTCGIFYFEVKIVSKGRDGYMGVGLCAQGVSMNRLPGWDKHSYGYHGDDGHSFSSSGTGQPYGPTFTTGDVIGCGYNLVDRTCFYTKNGTHLGTSFHDLPPQLYPTVGLQTPGEIVDSNFGQTPFLFDIEGEIAECRAKVHSSVENFIPPGKHGEWQITLNKIVCSYLVHHGYSETAKVFAKATGQNVSEELESIKNRQQIQKYILKGKIGKAIDLTNTLYPRFLETHPGLHFTLKVRQLIEIVCGTETVSMDTDSHADVMTNGKDEANGNGHLGDTLMDVDSPVRDEKIPHSRYTEILDFGKELLVLQRMIPESPDQGSTGAKKNGKKKDHYLKMLQNAYALVAYPEPWKSPLAWQLNADQREIVASALNSAILENDGYSPRSSLERNLAHVKYLTKVMASNHVGSCAFANLDDFIKT